MKNRLKEIKYISKMSTQKTQNVTPNLEKNLTLNPLEDCQETKSSRVKEIFNIRKESIISTQQINDFFNSSSFLNPEDFLNLMEKRKNLEIEEKIVQKEVNKIYEELSKFLINDKVTVFEYPIYEIENSEGNIIKKSRLKDLEHYLKPNLEEKVNKIESQRLEKWLEEWEENRNKKKKYKVYAITFTLKKEIPNEKIYELEKKMLKMINNRKTWKVIKFDYEIETTKAGKFHIHLFLKTEGYVRKRDIHNNFKNYGHVDIQNCHSEEGWLKYLAKTRDKEPGEPDEITIDT